MPHGTVIIIGGRRGQGPGSGHPRPVRGARRRARRADRGHQHGSSLGHRGGRALPRDLHRARRGRRSGRSTRSRRSQANDEHAARVVRDASGVFMTGGNQLRLSSTIGGTRLADAITTRFQAGAVVAGTSAGASAVSSHMIAFGASGATPKHRMAQIAAGLGLLPGVIVDQHFQQRNRLGRLLSLIAQNPSLLGLGVDEDTAGRRRAGPDHGGHRPGIDHGRRRRRVRDRRLGDPRPPPADDQRRRAALACPRATASTSAAGCASRHRRSTRSRAARSPRARRAAPPARTHRDHAGRSDDTSGHRRVTESVSGDNAAWRLLRAVARERQRPEDTYAAIALAPMAARSGGSAPAPRSGRSPELAGHRPGRPVAHRARARGTTVRLATRRRILVVLDWLLRAAGIPPGRGRAVDTSCVPSARAPWRPTRRLRPRASDPGAPRPDPADDPSAAPTDAADVASVIADEGRRSVATTASRRLRGRVHSGSHDTRGGPRGAGGPGSPSRTRTRPRPTAQRHDGAREAGRPPPDGRHGRRPAPRAHACGSSRPASCAAPTTGRASPSSARSSTSACSRSSRATRSRASSTRWSSMLPTLEDHACSLGRRGGFITQAPRGHLGRATWPSTSRSSSRTSPAPTSATARPAAPASTAATT